MVHRHNGVLLSYKKECNWVHSNEVNEPRAYYTEWSKSEREREILYTNACIWNLERWYQQSHAQGSKGDTDIKSRLLDSWEKERMGWFERKALKHTHHHMKTDNECKSSAWSGRPRPVLCANREGRGGSRWEGTLYTHGRFMLMYSKNHDNTVK